MCTKHGTVLLAACAMLATSSLSISAAHAQGFGYFLPPPFYGPPPPGPYYGPDFYDEAEPYYDEGPRDYRPLPRRRKHAAPVVRRKRPAATAVRRAPAPHKAASLAMPPKTKTVPTEAVTAKPEPPKPEPAKAAATSPACDEARSSVAGFGFHEITAQSCDGPTLSFHAVRDGKKFEIQVLAANGELTKVERLK